MTGPVHPVPGPDEVDLEPPGLEEVHAVTAGLIGAVAPDGRKYEPVQRSVLGTLARAMTGIDVDPDTVEAIDAIALADVLRRRSLEYRTRIVGFMILGEIVLQPLPRDVARRVEQYARALGINHDLIRIARRYADDALGLAWVDLRRLGFLEHWDPEDAEPLHTKAATADPFEESARDPALAERWRAFEEYPPDSLGRTVWEFYRTRGFRFPGEPGSASPLLAQHDFVHVIADYGSCIPNEFEVFALISRADPDPKGYAWIAMIIGLFETGRVPQHALFEMDVTTRWLALPGMGVRIADGIRRGALIAAEVQQDLMTIDYHALARRPVDEVRERLHVPPKCAEALDAGSVGPFDANGISEFQREAGRRLVESEVVLMREP